jgi:hypothetical protein
LFDLWVLGGSCDKLVIICWPEVTFEKNPPNPNCHRIKL